MSNHPHQRPQVERTLMKSAPRIFIRTATGTALPAVPLPWAIWGWRIVRCNIGDCRRYFLGRHRYNRHYVADHVYAGLI